MKEQYKTFKFQKKTLALIERANEVITEYRAQGFILTVRQIYYQFVARGWIPNELKSYGYVGAALNKGRMAGMIDWHAIEDRTRFLRGNETWSDPPNALDEMAERYKIDTRQDQDLRIEVWIEKDALVGVIDTICRRLDVDFFACRGYVSLSEMWRAAKRFIYADKPGIIFHLGDHDPSGIDMTRVIQDTLNTFGAVDVEVQRIALTMKQIKKFKPPPNPVKFTDSRSDGYVSKYGTESWELDALAPNMLEELIRENVEGLTDNARRRDLIKRQEGEREQLQKLSDKWDELTEGGWI